MKVGEYYRMPTGMRSVRSTARCINKDIANPNYTRILDYMIKPCSTDDRLYKAIEYLFAIVTISMSKKQIVSPSVEEFFHISREYTRDRSIEHISSDLKKTIEYALQCRFEPSFQTFFSIVLISVWVYGSNQVILSSRLPSQNTMAHIIVDPLFTNTLNLIDTYLYRFFPTYPIHAISSHIKSVFPKVYKIAMCEMSHFSECSIQQFGCDVWLCYRSIHNKTVYKKYVINPVLKLINSEFERDSLI